MVILLIFFTCRVRSQAAGQGWRETFALCSTCFFLLVIFYMCFSSVVGLGGRVIIVVCAVLCRSAEIGFGEPLYFFPDVSRGAEMGSGIEPLYYFQYAS